MSARIDSELEALQQRFGRFAAVEAFPLLQASDGFPPALWRKMGEAGLLGLGIPTAYGGSGGQWTAVLAAGEAFARGCLSLGMALSWMIHVVVSRFALLGFGSSGQIGQWLPRLAAGKSTLSLAISEPETGAHPKYLKTAAVRDGGDWILTGEKSFLTNGPLADLFVVLAVSSFWGGRKRLTAFLVPKETPGLSLTDPLRLGFLHPSPHCGIRFESCRIAADQVLGEMETAQERISLPFRDLEDAMLMGPVVGGMKGQASMLSAFVEAQGIAQTDALKTALGELRYRLDVLGILAYEAAAMLDDGRRHGEYTSVLLSFKDLAGQFQSRLEEVVARHGIRTTPGWAVLAKDIAVTVGVARNVALIKQKKLGEDMLRKKG